MALVFGHSQVKYLHEYVESDNIVTLCFSGYRILDFMDLDSVFDIIASMSVVVVVAGANDIPKASAAEVLSRMQVLCERIHTINPQATVMVCEILPRMQNGFNGSKLSASFIDRCNRIAADVNAALRSIETLVPWMKFLHIPGFVGEDGVNSKMLSRDGLHLSFEGTARVAACVEAAVSTELRTPPTGTPAPTTSPKHTPTPPSIAKFRKRYTAADRKQEIKVIETKVKFILNTDLVQTRDDTTHQKLVGGGVDVPIFSTTDRVLSHKEAADILHQNIPGSVTIEPPYRPIAGSVYLFSDNNEPSKKEDWRADGYTWRNYGKKLFEVDGVVLEKTQFRIINQGEVSKEFQKQAFRFTEQYNNKTVIVYLGNSEAYKNLPHGNRTKNSRPHKRSKPSLLENIKNTEKLKPQEVFDKMKSNNPNDLLKGTAIPRNPRQVKNIQAKLRREGKLSHDSLYALHLLVDQLDNYILSIKTTPDLEVVVGNNEIFEEFNRILQLKDETINLFYDTTFCLGDFYVSTLSFQHFMFKEKPIIPVTVLESTDGGIFRKKSPRYYY